MHTRKAVSCKALPNPLPAAKRVLLVEDDVDIQEAMLDILTEEGFEVATAGHGQDALSLLQSGAFSPHIILLDLMMPVMDGWTFRERQMADNRLQQIPVVVVSADRGARAKAEAMKVSACLTKPVDLPQLLDTLSALAR